MKKWKAKLKDNSVVDENVETPNWTQVQKDILSLELNNNGQTIKLPDNMPEYIQGKTASADPISGKCTLESRYIGFVENNLKILIRVNERTNNISIEIIKD